jgi:predicted DsbA family dithiol-disulfide isomerase
MLKLLTFIAFVLAVVMSLAYTPIAAQESPVIAEIGDHKVTAEELQKKEASKLLQADYKYYVAERDALDQLINDELLEMQAKREGVTVDELLKLHVVVQAQEPTEDQLRFYYEGLDTDRPFEVLRDKILESVHQVRLKKAREAYLVSLRSQFGVLIELAPPSAHVEIAGAPRLGPENAPVQLVEFADYECPYCQKVHPELTKLREKMGDRVALVYKDFPLPQHPLAEKAAEAARCADAQGKFWQFHDALFENKHLQIADLKQEARTLNLDAVRFDQCLDSGEKTEAVKKDVSEGLRLGLSGTPSFFANGHFLTGAANYAKLREMVEQELASPSIPQRAAVLAPSKDATQR